MRQVGAVRGQQPSRGYPRTQFLTCFALGSGCLCQIGPLRCQGFRQPGLEVRFHEDDEILTIGR